MHYHPTSPSFLSCRTLACNQTLTNANLVGCHEDYFCSQSILIAMHTQCTAESRTNVFTIVSEALEIA